MHKATQDELPVPHEGSGTPSSRQIRLRRLALAACCVLVFSKTVTPPLSSFLPPAPPQAFGAHDLAYRLMISGSTLVYMAFLLAGGVLGDLYGRRRLLLIGSISFVLANILCTLSTGLPMLFVCRLLIGASGALIAPLALAIIRIVYPPRERVIAIGIYTAIVGVATVGGPIVTQLLLQLVDWRLTYLLPIAGGGVGTLFVWRYIQESRVAGGTRRIDAIEAATWSVVLLSFLFGIIEVNSGVFSHLATTFALLLGIGGMACLAWLKFRPSDNMLRYTRINKRALAIAIVGGCLLNGVFIGCCLQLYNFLHMLRGYSVLQIAMAFLPLLPGLLIPIFTSERLAQSVDKHTPVTAGFLLLALGSFSLAILETQISYWWLILPIFVLGLGFGTASTHLTNLFISYISPDLVGTAAAVNSAYTQVGNSFGAIVLAAGLLWFGSSAYALATGLPPQQIRQEIGRINEIIQQTLTPESSSLPPINIHELGPGYQMAYAQGLAYTLLIAGGLCLAVAALFWFGFRQKASKTARASTTS